MLARYWAVFLVTAHRLLDFCIGICFFLSTVFDSHGLGDHDHGCFILQSYIFQELLAENKVCKLSCTDYTSFVLCTGLTVFYFVFHRFLSNHCRSEAGQNGSSPAHSVHPQSCAVAPPPPHSCSTRASTPSVSFSR